MTQKSRPPRLAERVLHRTLEAQNRDAVIGDLAEEYAMRRARGDGRARTRLWYWKQVLASVPPRRRHPLDARRRQRSVASPATERIPVMERLLFDLRQSYRMLRRAPGYAAATLATLVLGLGVTTVMFTIVYGVLARPLPYDRPDQLVVLLRGSADDPTAGRPMSYPAWEYLRAQSRAFDELAAYDRFTSVTFRVGLDPENLPAARVSANYFSTLGVGPALGRDFRPEDDAVGAPRVLILSHSVWMTRFGGDPGVVGRSIPLSQSSGTVIGVMPEDFRDIHDRARVWLPMATATRRADTGALYVVGRLAEGITPELAREDVERMRPGLSEVGLDYDAIQQTGLHDWRVGDVEPFLRLAAGALVLVVLIVVSNLSGLALVRGVKRHGELAIRTAIGASRWQLVRLALAESFLLGSAGAALALLVAWQAAQLFLRLQPDLLPRSSEIILDLPVLAFALAGGVLISLAAGLLASSAVGGARSADTLRAAGRTSGETRGAHSVQRALVVVQFGLAMSFLVGVGLLLRSLVGLYGVDTGFVAANALVVQVGTPAGVGAGDERRAYYSALLDRIRALPGVTAAGAVSFLPFTGSSSTSVRPDGVTLPVDDLPSVEIEAATPGYFEAMGTRILRGRDVADSDIADTPGVALINQAMADRFWPGSDALGRRIIDNEDDEDGPRVLTVVGVVENVRARGIDEPVGARIYTPYAQSDYWWPFGVSVVVRTAGSPPAAADPIRATLRDMVDAPPLATFTTLETWLADEFVDVRFRTQLFGAFALVAMLLAGIGLYGVVSSGVARRTHEFGVRLALGAEPGHLRREVLLSGTRLALLSLPLGAPLAWLVARPMTSLLYGVSALDWPTLAGTATVLIGISVLACWFPARRASRVPPIEAMRV